MLFFDRFKNRPFFQKQLGGLLFQNRPKCSKIEKILEQVRSIARVREKPVFLLFLFQFVPKSKKFWNRLPPYSDKRIEVSKVRLFKNSGGGTIFYFIFYSWCHFYSFIFEYFWHQTRFYICELQYPPKFWNIGFLKAQEWLNHGLNRCSKKKSILEQEIFWKRRNGSTMG